MFSFFNFKSYKKYFIKSVTLILALFMLITFVIFNITIKSKITNYENIISSKFNYIERTIDNTTNSINSYMNRVFLDTSLSNDLNNYLGKNAEGYISNRLNYDTYSSQIPFYQHLKIFAKEQNYYIKKVVFTSGGFSNSITYTENESTKYDFNIPSSLYVNSSDQIEFPYIYTRSIMSSNDYSDELGKISFVIDISKIAKDILTTDFTDAALYNDNYFFEIDNKHHILNKQLAKKFDESVSENTVFNPTSPTIIINSSIKYNYKLISVLTFDTIFNSTKMSLLFILLLMISLVCITILFIIKKLQYDYKNINNIFKFIYSAQNGKFEEIDPAQSKDEYYEIAKELNTMGKNMNHLINTEYTLKVEQQQAMMLALQNQINPHFLYNTLEVIRGDALNDHNISVANEIGVLGSLYRDIISTKDVTVTFKDEINIAEKYLKLMQLRYPTSFSYECDFDEEILSLPTIKCWMQPIIENFFKYGFDANSEYNMIIIHGYAKDDSYTIKFINNGKCITDSELEKISGWFDGNNLEETNSIGLKNVIKRLKLLYGDDISIQIENTVPQGVTTTVTIKKNFDERG